MLIRWAVIFFSCESKNIQIPLNESIEVRTSKDWKSIQEEEDRQKQLENLLNRELVWHERAQDSACKLAAAEKEIQD